jgi:omega-6 fatty acid desaturase (delta-12 desaturase)
MGAGVKGAAAGPVRERGASEAGSGFGRFLDAAARQHLTRRSTVRALAWFVPEYAAWIGFAVLALMPWPWFLSLGFGVLSGLMTGVVFTVGHDASHGALTPHRRLNALIARLAFIPSAHAASLWDVGHNRIHHGSTNLLGVDYVWAPLTPARYRAAGLWRRLVYRLYRSPAGHLPYYFVEMWLKKNLLPIAPETRPEWRRHLFDSLFVLAAQGVVIWAVIRIGAHLAPARPWWASLTWGWLTPFLFWNWLMGLVIYMHHTHPAIGWFERREDWSVHATAVIGTVEARLPGVFDKIDNNIMQHNAHHALPAIPMYRLHAAQARLRAAFPGVLASVVTPGSVWTIARACKLYDPAARRWCDYQGRPTAAPIDPARMRAPKRPSRDKTRS